MNDRPEDGPSQPSHPPYPVGPQPEPDDRPARRGPVEPLGDLTRWVVICSVLLTATTLAAVVAAFFSVDRLQEARADELVLTPYDVVGVLRLPFQALALVVTSVWLFRARQNVVSLRPEATQTRSPAWVVLGWLIPVVSLWFPFQVVRDVRRDATAPRHHRASARGGHSSW